MKCPKCKDCDLHYEPRSLAKVEILGLVAIIENPPVIFCDDCGFTVDCSEIVAVHINPPIPIRKFDWMAHFDGGDEEGPRGFGATIQEAVENLILEAEIPIEEVPTNATLRA